jgi:hypothetical protein
MPFTADQETRLLIMLAEWQTNNDAQAQSLIDVKQTATGQLRGLDTTKMTTEMAATVEAELKSVAAVDLKG